VDNPVQDVRETVATTSGERMVVPDVVKGLEVKVANPAMVNQMVLVVEVGVGVTMHILAPVVEVRTVLVDNTRK